MRYSPIDGQLQFSCEGRSLEARSTAFDPWGKAALHNPGEACELERALPAFDDLQLPERDRSEKGGKG